MATPVPDTCDNQPVHDDLPNGLREWRATISKSLPRLGRSIELAESRREQAASTWKPDGQRLRGLEELLTHLDKVASSLEGGRAEQALSRLVLRTTSDFETALEAGLSGYLAVASDAMRDVMEATDLILMFSTDTQLVEAWLDTPRDVHWKKFSPSAVRKHLLKHRVKYVHDSQATRDYKGHSEVLHVNPWPLLVGEKGIAKPGVLVNDMHFWEIFMHARDLVFALDALRDAEQYVWSGVERAENLREVAAAYDRTSEMQSIFIAAVEVGKPASWDELNQVVVATLRQLGSESAMTETVDDGT